MDTLTYSGTKTVQACPMSCGAFYCEKIGRPVLEGHEYDTPGYMVEYENGYQSWAPKDVFERDYRLSGTWQERLANERSELNERTNKLAVFVAGETFAAMPESTKEELFAQLEIQSTLLAVLDIRCESAGISKLDYGTAEPVETFTAEEVEAACDHVRDLTAPDPHCDDGDQPLPSHPNPIGIGNA